MRHAGIDIGSRSIEVVVVENGEVLIRKQMDTGFDPMTQVGEVLKGITFDRIMATGYGRNLVEIAFDAPTVTEIKAYGVGGKRPYPGSRDHSGHRGTGQQGHCHERKWDRQKI